MTNQQLTEFFNYAGLSFSNDPEDLRLLKKQLLLELKSSGNDALTVGGRSYSKNDILALFDGSDERIDTVRDTEDLLEDFPLLKKILHPEKIFLFIKFPETARQHPDFDYFCRQEAQPRFQEFLQRLHTVLKEDKLEAAAALLVFLELFTDEQRYKAESNVKIILRNKFASMKETPGFDGQMTKYFNNGYYYDIIRMIAANDADFLFEQLRVAESKNRKGAGLSTLISMYNFQAQLPFSDDILDHITNNLTQLKKQRTVSVGTGKSSSSGSSDPSPFRIVWIVLVALLFIARICMRMNRNDSNTQIDWHQYDQYRPPMGAPEPLDSTVYEAEPIQEETELPDYPRVSSPGEDVLPDEAVPDVSDTTSSSELAE